MKYVILIHHNAQARALWEGFGPEERAAGLDYYASINDELAESGELIVTEALADPSLAKIVTMDDGAVIVSDGPFVEAKEHLAGFYLIDCETEDRALAIAARIPEASLGLVEVRPVMGLEDFDLGGLEM
jgi:hypothetical protein